MMNTLLINNKLLFHNTTKSIRHWFLIIIFLLLDCLRVNAQPTTNVGTDFWIAFPRNQSSAELKIFVSSNYTANCSAISAYPGVTQSFSVTPGILTQINVPVGVALAGGVENKGIRITATHPIAVYGLNKQLGTTDAFLGLPVIALGTDYRIMTYKGTLGVGYDNGTSLSVVATQNGTILNIYNKQNNNSSIINLDEGQTYFIEMDIQGDDFTGSRVQSNYPVAVFGSVVCVNIPDDQCPYCDHIVEQLFPISALGKNYITVPLAGRDGSGDIFRVLATEDITDVSINGTSITQINAGEFYETNLSDYNSITTNKPVMVAQFAKGKSCSGNITGDPLMMLIFPREQFLTNYTIGTVAGFNSHWVNIVASSEALGTIYQDGVLIPGFAFTPVGTTGFYGAQQSITGGTHTFTSTNPFGVFVYGWTNANSYGYPGGGSLSPVATVTSVTLSPATSSGILNVTSLCFTAHVENNSGNPVNGILVNFYISGISPLTGHGYTDAAGNAEFCYTQTGTVPGIDEVSAEVSGNTSITSLAYWNLPGPCINPSDGGNIGTAQTGCPGYDPAMLLNLALPSGESGTLEYKWQISTTGSSSGFTDIAGSNSENYDPPPISQTTWFRRLARVNCMTTWAGAALSNTIEITDATPVPVIIKHN